MENVKRFLEKVQTDAALQEKLKAMQGKPQVEVITAIMALAKENGFEITKEDLQKYVEAAAKASAAQNGELNEAELDAVAGGGLGEWIGYSVLSFGVFCAGSAVGRIFDTCALDHPENLDHDYSM